MKKQTFALIAVMGTLMTSISAVAGMSKTFRVEGIVDSINHNEITLWVKGKLMKVNRDTIPQHYRIAPNEPVEAFVPSKSLIAASKKKR
jgi:hypothetical protein